MIAAISGQKGPEGVGQLETDDLEALSAQELHERSVHYAVHHGDLGFLWDLLGMIPAAQASGGNEEETTNDLSRISALLSDAMASGQGNLGENLRPFYIDYLSKHPEA
jgi:hypothetical protein